MNPLSASSLNAERARVDTARPPAAPADGAGGGFAQLLQGARDVSAPPKPSEAPRTERPRPDDEGAARAEAKERAARADRREAEDNGTKTDGADGADAADDTERSDRPRETGPTLAHWLLNGGAPSPDAATAAAGGALPPAQQAAPTEGLKAAAMAREVLDAVRQRARAGAGGQAAEAAPADPAAPTATGAAARRGDAAKTALRGADAADAAAMADAGATTRETSKEGGKTEARFAEVLNHTAHGAGTPAPLAAAGEAAPAAAASADPRVDTPVHDAGFGAAVGVTISRMAKDGLHQASLQLNPAELGPVAVRIEMQGHEARLSLSAAHAETRALLDASLPALTEAFRADGLVLAASQVGEMGREQGSGFAGQGGAGAQAQADAGGPGARGQWSGGNGGQGPDSRQPRGGDASPASRVTQITMPLPTAAAGRARGGATGGLDLYA